MAGARYLLLALVLSCVMAAAMADHVSVERPNTDRGSFKGGDVITIFGSGFRTFSEVTCFFGDRFAGYSSTILSDQRIECRTPFIDASDSIFGFPLVTSLSVMFDGDASTEIVLEDVFILGPTLDSFSPSSGFVEGGNDLTISGTNFNDFSSLEVHLDNSVCPVTSRTDEQIICTVPAGDFNQNAVVSIIFEDNEQFFVRSRQTYHYGPQFVSITPQCGSLVGGTTVTLTGVNLDDPIIASNVFPVDKLPTVELVFSPNDDDADIGDTRLFGADVTIDAAAGTVTFVTPFIRGDTFGLSPLIFVDFKMQNFRAVQVPDDFQLGPIVYNAQQLPTGLTSIENPSPQNGHRGGGDIIVLSGCGLSDFTNEEVSILLNVGGTDRELCVRGAGPGTPSDTVTIFSGCNNGIDGCDQIFCFTNPEDCTSAPADLSRSVTVAFNPTNTTQFRRGPYVRPNSGFLEYSVGPVVESIDIQRSNFDGGEVFTITGSNFFEAAFNDETNPGWGSVDVHFSAGADVVTASGTIVSDTEVTGVTPAFNFNVEADVSVDFRLNPTDNSCVDLPRVVELTSVFFGPTCSTISPSNGRVEGGDTVTLSGLGFLEADAADIEILLCLDRLNPIPGQCTVFQPVDSTTVSVVDDRITFVTPSDRDGVTTNVGSNRLFGDSATIYVNYPTITGAVTTLVPCGTYRFGPVVSRVTPDKGPSGPEIPGPLTPVTITGSGFSDVAFRSNILSSMGEVVNQDTNLSTTTPATSITALTTYTDESNVDKDVIVIFGASNTTSSDTVISWGPAITGLSGPNAAPTNAAGNVWGLLPAGGQALSVFGVGFDEFIVDGTFEGRCLVNGVNAPITSATATEIVCQTPAADFGTEATVSVDFGHQCGREGRANFRNRVTATQVVNYTPRIDTLLPNSGNASGNENVVVNGEGFLGWSNLRCFFGHFTDGVVRDAAQVTDATVDCTTPAIRGEFGTDVTVHIQLNDPSESFIHHMKVISAETFHYGAVCSSVTPGTTSVSGGDVLTISGSGFVDCLDSFNTPFSECTFNTGNVLVFFEDLVTGELRGAVPNQSSFTSTEFTVSAPTGTCMETARVFLDFQGALVTDESQLLVQCGGDEPLEFNFGPQFASQSSEFSVSNDSYGWTGDSITITGEHFVDVALNSPTCIFGEFGAGTTVSTTDTEIVCNAPAGAWDTWVDVHLEFIAVSNNTASCTGDNAVAAGRFHYGPIISTLSPTRGFVRDQTDVTITGFAFECCGIDSYSFVWPATAEGVSASQTTFVAPNSVVAPVPQNDAVDNSIRFIGVRFDSPLFTDSSVDYKLTRNGDDEGLTYFYGPIVESISPERSSLSGEGVSITIHGQGFSDPYLLSVACDFRSLTGSFDDQVAGTTVDDTTIVCPVKTYNHVTGDSDEISPLWVRDGDQFRNDLGSDYFFTAQSGLNDVTDLGDNPEPFFRDNGGGARVFLGPIAYGPEIQTVRVASSPSAELRSPAAGGLTIRIQLDDVQDWLATSDNSFGSELAVCVFGGVRLSDPVPINTDNSVVCDVPRGYVGLTTTVSVILDPHFDDQTTIPSTGSGHWRFLPFVTTTSKELAQEPGYNSVILNGGGFCNYDAAICTFGGREGIQGDILNDFTVSCTTPPNTPGNYPIEVSFCSDGTCFFDGTRDRVPAQDSLEIAGVNSISPTEGSLCGGTEVTFTGHGFTLYDFVTCKFGEFPIVAGSVIDDNTAVCFTPDFEFNGVSRFVECLDAVLIGHIGQSTGFPMLSPVAFEAGFPQPQSTDPQNADVDFSVEVTVIGRYFNGGFDREGEYFCSFGGIQTPATIRSFTEGSLGDLLFALTCQTPTRFTNPELTVGEVEFEVVYDCGSSADLSSSSTTFTFRQLPRIFDYNPKRGLEIGGDTVVATGDNFGGGSLYLCSFGELDVDNQIVAARFDEEDSSISCETPAMVVDRSVRVDFHISINGGEAWTLLDEQFTYQNIVRKCDSDSDGDDDDDTDAASHLLISLLPIVLGLCVVFL